MPTPSVEANTVSPRDMLMLRLSIVVGGILISLFMIGDLQLIPPDLASAYITNRALIQLPILAGLLAFTFPAISSLCPDRVFDDCSEHYLRQLLPDPRGMGAGSIQLSLRRDVAVRLLRFLCFWNEIPLRADRDGAQFSGLCRLDAHGFRLRRANLDERRVRGWLTVCRCDRPAQD